MDSKADHRISRLQRSMLAVPATSEHFFPKAAKGPADSIFLDLEDAVVPPRREDARVKAVAALNEVDWGNKTVSVRVNGLGTQWALQDILHVARCLRLDTVLVPKVETPEDVMFVDRLLTAIGMERPRERPLGIEIVIETPKGLTNVEAIAASSPRVEAIIFGSGDYSIELENSDTVCGVPNPDYAVLAPEADGTLVRHWNDQWHFALARIANACRANGLRPIDGAYADYGDLDGFRAACQRARALGFEGKVVIHPSQVVVANEAFCPRPEQIVWAREVLRKMEQAASQEQGAIGTDGTLIDRAHVKLAEKILRRAALAEIVTNKP